MGAPAGWKEVARDASLGSFNDTMGNGHRMRRNNGIVLDFGGCQYIDGKGDTIAGPHGSILINLTDYVGGRLKRGRGTFFSKGPYITVGNH